MGEPPLAPYLVIEGRTAAPQSLNAAMESTGVQAISYATIENGELATVRTVAADERFSDAPLRFQAASISKPVSALGILRFVEQRGLDLDADINEYLTSWKVDYTGFEDAPRVTIRRLLSHRAGLNVHGFPGYEPSPQIPSTLDVLEGRGNTEAIALFQAPGHQLFLFGRGIHRFAVDG
ncbi:serine hydrolase [Erythrobacter ani]|uniref:Beta-lactamase family protein n=1 Tax=Erythrobacter ani TaxID=2827235 RepID=A0ABS6SQ44_9SPHN|nr:serine hydrolase [Erythrobacter ani]MBV7267163.1 beta-lactamase family protein [Erythrobacter ani]